MQSKKSQKQFRVVLLLMSMSFSPYSFAEFKPYTTDDLPDPEFFDHLVKQTTNLKTKSNGSMQYFYRDEILNHGVLSFVAPWGFANTAILDFSHHKFEQLSISSDYNSIHANVFSLDLACDEIFDHIQDCNINNIYAKKLFWEKYPELRQVDQVDIQEMLEKNDPTEDRERDFNKMVVEILKIHLKANHFSAQFIDNFSKAAYQKLAIQ